MVIQKGELYVGDSQTWTVWESEDSKKLYKAIVCELVD